MDRRRFMKVSSAAGLSLFTPVNRHAIASEDLAPFDGPYWITINLAGAWDSTLFCDPKGDVTDETGNGVVNQCYTQEDIVTHTYNGQSVRLAPGIRQNGSGDSYYHYQANGAGEPIHIIDHLSERGLTLINGIDAGLTNHRFGEQMAMSGSTQVDFPTLAALVAYQRLVDRPDRNGPMPLLSFGGYDGSGDLLPVTRLNKLEVLRQITRPDVFGNGAAEIPMHRASTQNLIDEAVAHRQVRLNNGVRLPTRRRAMSQLFIARSKEQHVGEILREFNFADFESLSDLRKQSYVALRAFKSGLSVSANLFLDGWDTHNNNDLGQTNKMWVLFRALAYIKDAAESLGIADRLNIIVGSDFGRTTHYSSVGNPNSGKDHHPVTSWMTMLWDQGRDSGLRVIGETDHRVLARPLNAALEPTEDSDGTMLTPALIHNELRRIAFEGTSGPVISDAYPLEAPELSLWS